MSKEFEALEDLLSFAFVMSENMVGLTKRNYDEKEFVKKTDKYLQKYIKNFECRDILKQALTELQAIKEAKPSEALEWLNQQIQRLNDDLQHYTMVEKDKAIEYQISEDLKELNTIKQALLNAEKLEQENKFLKAALKTLIKIDDSDLSHLKIKVIPQNVAANQDVIKLLKEIMK